MRRMACNISFILVALSFVFAAGAFAGDFKTIDTAQLHAMVVDNAYELEGGRRKPYTIIDARTKEQYDSAHIASVISIPENDFEKSADILPPDKDVLLIVYGNDAKSRTAGRWAEKAAAAGYTNIVIYTDGFQGWKENELPIAPLENAE
jgi:rhodanese-related sulfurtransferase